MEESSDNNYLLYIATNKRTFVVAKGSSIEVIETASRKVVNRIEAAGIVKEIKISPDSTKVAWTTTPPSAGLYMHSVDDSKSLWDVENERTENGFSKLIWSPDSSYFAAVGDHEVFIDVYNVKDRDRPVITLNGPLHGSLGEVLCDFSPDSYYFASCERENFRFAVALYATEHDWSRIQEIDISDIIPGGLCWCCDSASFLVWQSLPKYHLLHITIDCTREYAQDLSDSTICSVELSDDGRLVAVQLDTGNIEIHDLLLRRQASELVHRLVLCQPGECRSVLRVPDLKGLINSNDDSVFCVECESEDETVLISFRDSCQIVRYPRNDLKPKFSACGKYLASYDPSFPTIIWIWVVFTQSVDTAVLLNREPSLEHEMKWHSVEPQLAVTLETNKILLWSTNCTVIVVNNVIIPPLTAALHFAIIESRARNSGGSAESQTEDDQEETGSAENSSTIDSESAGYS